MTEPSDRELPQNPAELRAFMDGLTFTNQPTELPPVPEGEVMVVRSLRLPVDLEQRVKTIASRRGVPTSVLIREWIADGLERAEAGEQRDPVAELHRIADAANRALQALERRNAA